MDIGENSFCSGSSLCGPGRAGSTSPCGDFFLLFLKKKKQKDFYSFCSGTPLEEWSAQKLIKVFLVLFYTPFGSKLEKWPARLAAISFFFFWRKRSKKTLLVFYGPPARDLVTKKQIKVFLVLFLQKKNEKLDFSGFDANGVYKKRTKTLRVATLNDP